PARTLPRRRLCPRKGRRQAARAVRPPVLPPLRRSPRSAPHRVQRPLPPASEHLRQGAGMTATTTPTEVPRDRYGRPLLVPPGGGDPQPYTRASTMAKALDDLSNLMAWRQRMTAVGLLRRPDLMTRVAGALANGTPDDWPVKRELNKVCAEATEAAGASSAASTGTGIHALVEAIAN